MSVRIPLFSCSGPFWAAIICGATAINVAGEQSNQECNASAYSQTTAGQTQTETRGTWHGRCVMNFLLAENEIIWECPMMVH
ncbi:hypothetical protein YC2023_101858 [Brassica napus]